MADAGEAKVRALIVDDDENMRELVRLLMELDGEIEVVGEADDACSGFRRWDEIRPDIAIIDYRMPGHNGLDLAAHILKDHPSAHILLFSAFLDDATTARADELGVRTVSKDQVRQLPALARAEAA
jgi:DNA-binding NarL/FixJ family response regulator